MSEALDSTRSCYITLFIDAIKSKSSFHNGYSVTFLRRLAQSLRRRFPSMVVLDTLVDLLFGINVHITLHTS
jgi:hypothetical protein